MGKRETLHAYTLKLLNAVPNPSQKIEKILETPTQFYMEQEGVSEYGIGLIMSFLHLVFRLFHVKKKRSGP